MDSLFCYFLGFYFDNRTFYDFNNIKIKHVEIIYQKEKYLFKTKKQKRKVTLVKLCPESDSLNYAYFSEKLLYKKR